MRGLLISLKEALICVGVLSGYTAGYLCAEQVFCWFSSGVGSCRQQVQEAAALAGAWCRARCCLAQEAHALSSAEVLIDMCFRWAAGAASLVQPSSQPSAWALAWCAFCVHPLADQEHYSHSHIAWGSPPTALADGVAAAAAAEQRAAGPGLRTCDASTAISQGDTQLRLASCSCGSRSRPGGCC